jgi:hypothetical protein
MNLQPWRASPALESFLLANCGPHFVCNEGTCMPDLESLIAWKQEHGDRCHEVPIPVYPYAEDSPFSPEADAAYQAWHDRLHAQEEYEFDMGGEIKLASYQFALAHHAGLPAEDCWGLFYFVYARVMYHYYHDGNEPPHRAKFVQACFKYGCKAAAMGCYEEQYANLHG